MPKEIFHSFTEVCKEYGLGIPEEADYTEPYYTGVAGILAKELLEGVRKYFQRKERRKGK